MSTISFDSAKETADLYKLQEREEDIKGQMETLSFKPELTEEMKNRIEAIKKSYRLIEQNLCLANYVKITAYDAVIEKLRKEGWAIITGLTGNGKSTLAYHIIHDIVNNRLPGLRNKQPIVITKPSHWGQSVGPYENRVVFIDNMFGTHSMTNVKKWKHVLDDISRHLTYVQTENSNLLLVAQRTEIYNECLSMFENHPFFQSVVDLTDESNFTKGDRLAIFRAYTHGLNCSFNCEDQTAKIQNSSFIGFPQCCSLFKCDSTLLESGATYFSLPLHLLQVRLKKMLDTENEKFCALALIMMNGGKIHETDFEFHLPELINKISAFNTMAPSNNEIIGKGLLDSAYALVGTYLAHNEEIFTFSHESIHHAVAMLLWEENKKEVIDKCSTQFLSCIRHESGGNEIGTVVAPKHIYETIANRVIKEMNTFSSISFKCLADMEIWNDIAFGKTIDSVNQLTTEFDWNNTDEIKCTLLHYATESKNIALIHYIMSKSPSQASLNAALTISSELPDLSLFNYFRSKSAQITSETAFSAIKGRNKDIFKKVIQRKLKFYTKFKSKQVEDYGRINLLQELCLSGNQAFFDMLIKRHSDRVLQKANEFSLLKFAVQGCSLHIVKRILQLNKSIDITRKDKKHATALHIACSKGQIKIVTYLCESYPLLVQINGRYNRTPLHYTADGAGSVDVATYLIGKGVNVHAKDEHGETVLHISCYKGNLPLVTYLCERWPVLLQTVSQDYNTPLQYIAVGTGSVHVANYLAGKGLNVYNQNKFGDTVLHAASYSGYLGLVEYLCVHYPELLDIKGQYDRTPLHYAALGTGTLNVAIYLIDQGMDVYAGEKNRYTAFHNACYSGNLSLVKHLCDHFPKLPHITGQYGRTSLQYTALGTGSVEVAVYLIGRGLNVKTKDELDETILHNASYNGKLSLLKYLCGHFPALVHITGRFDRTPLHYTAFGTGSVGVAVYLIDRGLKVDTTDKHGDTMLHIASYAGNIDLVKFLCSNYPDLLLITGQYNGTALHFTGNGTGSVKVASYLIGQGLAVDIKDEYGDTILHKASCNGHLSLVKYLCNHHPELLQITGQYNGTPLHYTGNGTGSVDVAKYLIDKNQNVDTKDSNGDTVLHRASANGNLSLVKYLCDQHPALLQVAGGHNYTSLHYAASGYDCTSTEVAIFLICQGINVHALNEFGDNVLHKACYEGNFYLVKYLCHQHPDLIKVRGKSNKTPLHYTASGTGSVDVAMYLIDRGVNIVTKDEYGCTILHTACYKGHVSLVTYLCDHHPELLAIRSGSDKTLLHQTASGTGSVDVAAYLIDRGVNIDTKDKNGDTVLHTACYKGHVRLVTYLCDHHPELIEIRDSTNRTPLHNTASGTGSVDVAAYLIDRGVNIDTKDKNGDTVLHTACYKGHVRLVTYLCDRHPELLEIRDSTNRTPLHNTASGTGSVDVAAFLIDRGANIDTKDEYGCTILHTTCYKGQVSLVTYLCDHHPELIEIRDKSNRTLLHCTALGTGAVDVAKQVIGRGVDIETKDEYGDTVLHTACFKGHKSLVKYLCDHHPEFIQMKGKSDRTLLHCAASGTGSVDVATYLIDRGANIVTKDEFGNTVLHTACCKGHVSLVTYLCDHHPELLAIKGWSDTTLLHQTASGTGSVDVAKYLIGRGVNIETKNANRDTVLHTACYKGNFSLVEYLCDHCPELIKKRGWYNTTALHSTANGTGSVEVTSYLIGKGLNSDTKDYHGDTVLHRASFNCHLSLVKYLCERYPVLIHVRGRYNTTPLHHAVFGAGCIDVAIYLIKQGISVDIKDEFGDTVLHKACYKGNTSLVTYLGDHYPELLSITGQYDRTPLHYTAEGTGSMDIMTYLIGKGLNANAKDEKGISVYQLAEKRKHSCLCQYLETLKLYNP